MIMTEKERKLKRMKEDRKKILEPKEKGVLYSPDHKKAVENSHNKLGYPPEIYSIME